MPACLPLHLGGEERVPSGRASGVSERGRGCQRHLNLELYTSYPDNVTPANLVAQVKQVHDEGEALRELCWDLLTQKQAVADVGF
ncbi:unnamed protein product [Urochloa humidicola]